MHAYVVAELRRIDQEWHEHWEAGKALSQRRNEIEALYPETRRIGDRIRRARKNLGLSQQLLARIAGLHPSTISSIECGHGVSTTSLIHLSQTLGVTIDWMLRGDEEVES
jgi:ribosome-binding protein aMBF1 (putative translation factor)